METRTQTPNQPARRRLARVLWIGLALSVTLIALAWIQWLKHRPVQIALADGRLLVIEGVSYGTKVHAGQPSALLNRFRPWLPNTIYQWLAPKHPQSEVQLLRPGLVVWINTLDPKTGTNVDCQMLRFECVSAQGDVFESSPHWFGAQNFWRVGHVFESWPRDESSLTFRITPYRTNQSSLVSLANPHLMTPAGWMGKPLPQTQSLGNSELVLTRLTLQTNRTKFRFGESSIISWEPQWEFRRYGKPVTGWQEPEWVVEDPLGNRGRRIGIHQRALKFEANVYPQIDDTEAVSLVGLLPPIDLGALQTNQWWNLSLPDTSIVALGICPPGVWSFSGGQVDTNPVSKMGAVRGGARSGWTSARKQINPLQVKTTHAHYTPSPTIYLQAADLPNGERVAIRAKDQQGRFFALRPEPQGAPDGVRPFLLDLPDGITNITAEVVILKPVRAEFYVDTDNVRKQ